MPKILDKISLSLFLSHINHGVVIASFRGRILFTNALFDVCFLKNRDDAKLKRLDDVFKDNPSLIGSIQKVIDVRGTYTLRNFAVKRSDGTLVQMDVEAFPLVHEESKTFSVCLIFYDRSGSQHFEEHQKRLDRDEYLKTIASGLAHEIKNPLSGIKGASQLIMSEAGSHSELKEYAAIIQQEVVRVDRLLQDLMHFTKPRKLKMKKVNLNRILNDISTIQETVVPHKIQFNKEFDPSLPDIKADAEALSQVFLNLIKNARQSIKDNGHIILRSRIVTDFLMKKKNKKHQVIGVDVEDTGCGMEKKEMEQIFVPFYTSKPKGTGLGLTLCHQIIEEHEGDIQVLSEKGKGTKVSVFLPVY